MVFRFGDVKITPTLEEINDCLDSIGTCGKRKKCPNHHILVRDRPTSKELKEILLLLNTNRLETHDISLMTFFDRWGHDKYFRLFRTNSTIIVPGGKLTLSLFLYAF